jgi:hypothetical protein
VVAAVLVQMTTMDSLTPKEREARKRSEARKLTHLSSHTALRRVVVQTADSSSLRGVHRDVSQLCQ